MAYQDDADVDSPAIGHTAENACRVEIPEHVSVCKDMQKQQNHLLDLSKDSGIYERTHSDS